MASKTNSMIKTISQVSIKDFKKTENKNSWKLEKL